MSQEYTRLVAQVREDHAALDARDLSFRRAQLRGLGRMMEDEGDALLRALKKDLGTPAVEGAALQVGLVASEVRHALKNLSGWAAPRRVPVPLHLQPASASVIPEPLGTALVIGAWNYPVLLTLSPLVAAVAAGNAAIIKPSEMAPATAAAIAEALPKYMSERHYPVVEGGVPETTALLREKFDKIFFTGSAAVGKIVMKAAAEHLTPVTLELGGQSPCIVDRTAHIARAAARIAFAKYANAGQTCVAPNHVFVHEDVAEKFTEALQRTVTKFYGKNPKASPDYGRIVNARHHARLVALMKGQRLLMGGWHDAESLYIAPTALKPASLYSPVMREEIFGPILPIIAVRDLARAFNHVAENPRPLAAYVFTGDRGVMAEAQSIRAGAVAINNAMVHLGVHDLPFGGTGESGFGQYHGKAGFDAFSHLKPVFRAGPVEPGAHHPPYGGRNKTALLKAFKII